MSGNDWATRGACRTADPDMLFVQGAAQNRAKAVCMPCPVRTECLADALDSKTEFGVWGGMTERERRALLRRRPNVASWARLFEIARAEHERANAIMSPDFDISSAVGAAGLAGSCVLRSEAPQLHVPAQLHHSGVTDSVATQQFRA